MLVSSFHRNNNSYSIVVIDLFANVFEFQLLVSEIPGELGKSFPLLKIQSTKSTSQIWIIQILVKSRKIQLFL